MGVLLLGAGAAEALPEGVATANFSSLAVGCHTCHVTNPGTAPMVMLSADDLTLNAGQQITLTFVVTSQAIGQTGAGFNISASQAGTFAVGGANAAMTRTIGTGAIEATHSGPKANTAGVATFSTLWTPGAAVTGTVTFTAWGNSVNLNTFNTGDRAASTTLAVTVAACVPTTWYRDADSDTFGDADMTMSACAQPTGYVANNSDCDDDAAAVKPGATELCNGEDDDCDGTDDDGLGMLTCGAGMCAVTIMIPACVGGNPQTCPTTCSDAGTDSGTDVGADTGTDAGTDGGTDSGADAGTDGGTDGGTDAGTDAGTDRGTDRGVPVPVVDAADDMAPVVDVDVVEPGPEVTPPQPDTGPEPDTAPVVDAAPIDDAIRNDRPASADSAVADARDAATDRRISTSEGDGCDCAVGAPARTGALPLGAVALLLLTLVRRRRRR